MDINWKLTGIADCLHQLSQHFAYEHISTSTAFQILLTHWRHWEFAICWMSQHSRCCTALVWMAGNEVLAGCQSKAWWTVVNLKCPFCSFESGPALCRWTGGRGKVALSCEVFCGVKCNWYSPSSLLVEGWQNAKGHGMSCFSISKDAGAYVSAVIVMVVESYNLSEAVGKALHLLILP